MKKILLLITLLMLSSCYKGKTREEERQESIERLDEGEKNTEGLFEEMEDN